MTLVTHAPTDKLLPTFHSTIQSMQIRCSKIAKQEVYQQSSSKGYYSHQLLGNMVRCFWNWKLTNSSSAIYTGSLKDLNSGCARINALHSVVPSMKSFQELQVDLS